MSSLVIAVVRKMSLVPVARPDSELGAAPVRGPNKLGNVDEHGTMTSHQKVCSLYS